MNKPKKSRINLRVSPEVDALLESYLASLTPPISKNKLIRQLVSQFLGDIKTSSDSLPRKVHGALRTSVQLRGSVVESLLDYLGKQHPSPSFASVMTTALEEFLIRRGFRPKE